MIRVRRLLNHLYRSYRFSTTSLTNIGLLVRGGRAVHSIFRTQSRRTASPRQELPLGRSVEAASATHCARKDAVPVPRTRPIFRAGILFTKSRSFDISPKRGKLIDRR